MNDDRLQADDLDAFLDAYAAGKTVTARTPEAELAATLVDLASSLPSGLPFDQYPSTYVQPSLIPQRAAEDGASVPHRRASWSFSLPLVAVLLLCFFVGALLLPYFNRPALAPPVQDTRRLPIPVGGHLNSLDPVALEAMRSAGMEWTVFKVSYERSAQEAALRAVRELIDGAHLQGFRIWVTLADAPGASFTPEDFPGFAQFAGQVAALGADAVQIDEIPNLSLLPGEGQIDPASYVSLLQQSYEAVKAANPDTLVISGALAPTSSQSSFSNQIYNDDVYYEGMAEAGAANYADCIGVNYYEGAVDPSVMEGDLRGSYATRYFVPMLQRAATPFRESGIPVCLSEYGYLAGTVGLPDAYDWSLRTTPEDRAEWLAKGIRIAAELSSIRVAMVMIFRVDEIGNSVEDGFAIVQPDGTCIACDSIATLRQ